MTENLFFNTNPNGGYVITYVPNTNLQLGQVRRVDNQDQDQMLICKFTGEYDDIIGEYTQEIQQAQKKSKRSSKVYIGYRSISDKNMRVAAMAAIKGTANRLRANPVPDAGYKAEDATNYYQKEHYALEQQEYNNFTQAAVNDFANKLAARGNIKYGAFLFPESRSENARDLCNLLRDSVGVNAASPIEALDKITITNNNIFSIFEINNISNAIIRKLEQLAEDNVIALNIPPQTTLYAQVVRAARHRLVNAYNNNVLSTASDTRATSMHNFMRGVCDDLHIKLPTDRELKNMGITLVGGHLDGYTKPHYNAAEFLKNYIDRTREPRQRYRVALQNLTTVKVGDRERIERTVSHRENDMRVLIVDDNINSGDLYKQINSIVTNVNFKDVPVDFFFLMCKQDYAAA